MVVLTNGKNNQFIGHKLVKITNWLVNMTKWLVTLTNQLVEGIIMALVELTNSYWLFGFLISLG